MQFPLDVWDFSLWSAFSAIVLLVTSELLSPHYGRSRIALNRRRLRMATFLTALIFLSTVALKVYEILKS